MFVSIDVSIPDRQATLLSLIVKREYPDHVRAASVTEVSEKVRFVIEQRRPYRYIAVWISLRVNRLRLKTHAGKPCRWLTA